MRILIFVFFAQFVLSHPAHYKEDGHEHQSHEQGGVDEVEVGVKTDDLWCFSNKDCGEDSECAGNRCVLKGTSELDDLENCVKIEVRGFTKFCDEFEEGKWSKYYYFDGVYTLAVDKHEESSGGKAFSKPSEQQKFRDAWGHWEWGEEPTRWMYWNAQRKYWVFDEDLDTQYLWAFSNDLPDDSANAKRFTYWLGGEWRRDVPISMKCLQYETRNAAEYENAQCRNDWIVKKDQSFPTDYAAGTCIQYFTEDWESDCACDCTNNKHVENCAAYDTGEDFWVKKCCYFEANIFDESKITKEHQSGWDIHIKPELLNDGTDRGCSTIEGQQYSPLDYGSNGRSVEQNAADCATRCLETDDCIGSTWWHDGGCHLATYGASLRSMEGVTTSKCIDTGVETQLYDILSNTNQVTGIFAVIGLLSFVYYGARFVSKSFKSGDFASIPGDVEI